MSDQEEIDDDEIVLVESDSRSVPQKVNDFSSLLNDIENLSDKKRQLWREIYENAITDRQNSYVMFSKLAKIVKDQSTEHAIHGKTIATYIDKMSKANDQLIRLAELVAKADKSDETINPDEMFELINRKDKR